MRGLVAQLAVYGIARVIVTAARVVDAVMTEVRAQYEAGKQSSDFRMWERERVEQ